MRREEKMEIRREWPPIRFKLWDSKPARLSPASHGQISWGGPRTSATATAMCTVLALSLKLPPLIVLLVWLFTVLEKTPPSFYVICWERLLHSSNYQLWNGITELPYSPTPGWCEDPPFLQIQMNPSSVLGRLTDRILTLKGTSVKTVYCRWHNWSLDRLGNLFMVL